MRVRNDRLIYLSGIRVERHQNKHINSILISKDRKSINTICFNAKNTELESYLCEKKKILNIVGKLSLNNWLGKKQVQFIINDISIN